MFGYFNGLGELLARRITFLNTRARSSGISIMLYNTAVSVHHDQVSRWGKCGKFHR